MIDFVSHIIADGERFISVAEEDLEAHVPTCPEWDIAALVSHLGGVHREVAVRVRTGDLALAEPDIEAPPTDPGALLNWFRIGLEDLTRVLSSTPADAPAWSWAGDPTAGFWRRRMAHETAVHRWDAENALDVPQQIEAELAVDGIDELFDIYIGEEDDPPYEGVSGTVLLVADAGPRWSFLLEKGNLPGGTRDGDGGSLTVKGTSSDLLLLMWNRLSLQDLDSSGETSVWDGWRAYAES